MIVECCTQRNYYQTSSFGVEHLASLSVCDESERRMEQEEREEGGGWS